MIIVRMGMYIGLQGKNLEHGKEEKMYGAIIGDISGAGHEFQYPPLKDKNYQFFEDDSFFTDDTVMTCAVAKSLLECDGKWDNLPEITIKNMQDLGRKYPNVGYGGMFSAWLYGDNPKPYNSFGNGSAMRVSPVGWVAKSLQEAVELSEMVTSVTHNHPEGIKGAEAVAICIWMARNEVSKEDMQTVVNKFYYPFDFTLDEIRPSYFFDVTCQGSVPQALQAFFEAESFEDAVRNAISLGGDTDTQGAITGSIAEAYYGIPQNLIDVANERLRWKDDELYDIVTEFRKRYVK